MKRPRGQGLILTGGVQRSPTFEARFWSRVDMGAADECWPWKGGLAGTGYGDIMYGIVPERTDRTRYISMPAHQASWVIHGNTMPTWPNVIDHTCRNRACVNPAHLRIVHQGINTLENSDSNYAKNKAKTQCKRGHPFAGENLAMYPTHRNPRNPEKVYYARVCLTCFPNYWRFAIVPRCPPKGARLRPGEEYGKPNPPPTDRSGQP